MRRLAVSAVVGVAVFGGAAPVAADGEPARCQFEYFPELEPGASLAPGSGKVTSHGTTGIARCTGSIDAKAITGEGKFGFEGMYGTTKKVTCQDGGDGTGHLLLELPTEEGPVRLKDPVEFVFGPSGGYPTAVGDWTGERSDGYYAVLPVEGDCVTGPVTKLRGQGVFEVRS